MLAAVSQQTTGELHLFFGKGFGDVLGITHLKQQKRGRSLEEILDLVHRYRRSRLSQRQFIVGEGICLTTLHQYLWRAKAGNQGAVNVAARSVVENPQALEVKEWPGGTRIEPAQWVEVMTRTDEADEAGGAAEPARGRCMEMDAIYGVGFLGGIRLDIPRRFVGSEVAELLALLWVVSLKSASHSPVENASSTGKGDADFTKRSEKLLCLRQLSSAVRAND